MSRGDDGRHMAYCRRCGHEMDPAIRCPSCGWAEPDRNVVAPTVRNGQAVASLVLGIVGLVVCPVVPSVLAIILGNQARARTGSDDGFARAGVILGWVGVGLTVVGALIVMALASFGAF